MFSALFRRKKASPPAPAARESSLDKVLSGRVAKSNRTPPRSTAHGHRTPPSSSAHDFGRLTPLRQRESSSPEPSRSAEGVLASISGTLEKLGDSIRQTIEKDGVDTEGGFSSAHDCDSQVGDNAKQRNPTEDDDDPLTAEQPFLDEDEDETNVDDTDYESTSLGEASLTPFQPESTFEEEEEQAEATQYDDDDDDDEDDDDELIISEDDEEEESDWEIDPAEMEAYETSRDEIDDVAKWTRDERQLHKLLSLRAMYPLMPGSWSQDFLGVPMYPSLFAPVESDKEVLIHNRNNQFRATKALRNILELQARVHSLRQVGIQHKIARTIEKELKRYIKWAMQDAGLDRYEFMPNISIKRFDSAKINKRNTAKMIERYFRDWAVDYRAYYAEMPQVTPPRLLYGLVIIQHAVMLLTIDSARPKAKARCFADFNIAQEDQWLDSCLNVAIPIHLARKRLIQMTEDLPKTPSQGATGHDDNDDDDA